MCHRNAPSVFPKDTLEVLGHREHENEKVFVIVLAPHSSNPPASSPGWVVRACLRAAVAVTQVTHHLLGTLGGCQGARNRSGRSDGMACLGEGWK